MDVPAISSDQKTASAAILAAPGRLCGIFVVHDGAANDMTLELWDSPDSTLTLDKQLTPDILIKASPAAGACSQLFMFGEDGIYAAKGIYAKLTSTSTIKFVVYYK